MATPQPPYDGAPTPSYSQAVPQSNSQPQSPPQQSQNLQPRYPSGAPLEPPKSLWERPRSLNMTQPEPVYQQQQAQQGQNQGQQPIFGDQQKGYGGPGQPGQGAQTQVVYVKDDKRRHEDAALGCCAGCLAGCCCCGCTVM